MTELEKITKAFAASFAEKARALESSWEQFTQAPEDSSGISKQLHELAGSTGVYGFHSICDQAQRAQRALHSFLDGGTSFTQLDKQIRKVILSLQQNTL